MMDALKSLGLFEPVVVLPLLAVVATAPIFVLVAYRRRQWKRREQERIRREMEGREHPHFTLDRTKKPKGKLKRVEPNTMSLGLQKLVRTGSPYDKGVMG